MLDLMPTLGSWQPALSGQRCAVATIVACGGSVPRPMGTSMLVSEHGEVLGSLSGGCVEGAVVEAALESMRDGGSRLELFGYSAEDAFAVGLSCGGELEVHIQPADPAELAGFGALAGRGAGAALALIRRLDAPGAVVVDDPAHFRAAASADLARLLGDDPAVLAAAAAQLEPLLRGGRAGLVRLESPGGCDPDTEPITLFVESRLPAPRMLVFGANDFAAALIPAGKLLGYHVTLCDARPAFTGQERFRAADELATAWPHRYLAAEAEAGRIDARTVVCVLSHDPKFDIPLLRTALDLASEPGLAYVGAMGSRRSHRQRVDSLLAEGTTAEALQRLHSPIGLDLGAVTPAEVAVSVTAEIIASRGNASAAPLRNGSGPIHATDPSMTSTSTLSTSPARKAQQWT
ncbi:XdhC family protein [Arthrobacter celericrescens]|uniref:XdhC family protein n=1 Tax=Arthrobacter celericrescens TaxID=2320851 RepID=UPI000EA1C97B|nr:XdhC/CoxI family protein [Arthrobacter celericrescens]